MSSLRHIFISLSLLLFTKSYISESLANILKHRSINYQYYPRYHFAPPYGWMNDPNGLCVVGDEYHLFYQFNPHSSLEPGIAHWGHAKSKDLLNWEHLPIAMYPDQWYDKTGVFSGSAIVENNTIYLFYTGNVNHPGKNPNHIQRQALAKSVDGINFKKYEGNPIIREKIDQPDIRDPKTWKHNDKYYMVLGNSYNNGSRGRAILFASDDMKNWNEVTVLDKSSELGEYMWECPDFFPLNSLHVLIYSPQGIEPQGDKYNNLYQTGYILGIFNYDTHKFTSLTTFRELDHGHDFYATQTTVDNKNRRILLAWFDMWEQYYPERKDGWSGHLTIPRELTVSLDGRLLQQPLEEMELARASELYYGKAKGGTIVSLENKAGEILIRNPVWKNLELFIESQNVNSTVSLQYDFEKGQVTLNRGGIDGIRRTKWQPWTELKWRIFVDASSIELFCGEGEVTFSSRFFPEGRINIRLENHSELELLQVYSMKTTLPKP